MYECEKGHATAIVSQNGLIYLCMWDKEKEPLYKIRVDIDFEADDMQDRLDIGECPICDIWEYIEQ